MVDGIYRCMLWFALCDWVCFVWNLWWEKGARTFDEGAVGPLRSDGSLCKLMKGSISFIPLIVHICIYSTSWTLSYFDYHIL